MDLDSVISNLRAFQESRVLLTAVELDVFTAIGDGSDAAQVAARVQADPRATEMLLNALAACGALTKHEGVFRNTPILAQHFTGGARNSWMHLVNLWDSWSTLTSSVRQGTAARCAGVEGRGEEWTEAFIAAMHHNASERAPQVVRAIGTSGLRRVLDVGGGSGAYSIAFAQAVPELEADLLDLEPVTRIARRHITEAGLMGRVHTRVGDLRHDALGEGYDLIFVSAICHMLNEAENRDLIRRCARAGAPGGRVVVQDFILDPDGTSPKQAALFSLNMLVGTPGGRCYTEAECAEWMRAAGLTQVRRARLPGPADLMIGTAGAA